MRPNKTQERREHPRKSCSLAVKGFAGDSAFKALARNASLGGVFIETPNRFPADETIFLLFNAHPLYAEPIMVVGRTAWGNSRGVGIEFTDVPLSLTTMIESFG